MSWDHLKDAYRTRLGNLTAKSVLTLIVGEATLPSASGLAALLNVDRIAALSEMNQRTARRIVQVFEEIGLARRLEIEFRGRQCEAIEVNLNLLGSDLQQKFQAAYGEAQKQRGLTDRPGAVSQTGRPVSQTGRTVSQTAPPNPLNGGSSEVRLGSTCPPDGGDARKAPEQPEPCGLDAEQLAFLDGLKAKGREGDLEMWRRYFQDENRSTARLTADAQAEQERIAELRAAMPTAKAARAWVMRECGFVASRRGRELEEVLEAVLQQDRAAGIEWWTTGLAMAAAWKRYQANGARLRVLYGPVKFYQLGIWRDDRGWAWNQDVLRDERRTAEARVGS